MAQKPRIENMEVLVSVFAFVHDYMVTGKNQMVGCPFVSFHRLCS